MRTLKLTSIVAAAALLVGASSLPAELSAADFSKSEKVTLRLTSASPEGMEDSLALKDAAAYLEKESQGTVILDLHFSSSLFGEIPGIEAAQSGLIDLAIACTCNMTKLTSSMLFSDLPYIWQAMDNGTAVWDGEVGDKVRAELLDKLGLRAVAFTPSGGGYRIFWNTKREVRVPADAAGLKVRTTATPIEQRFWESVGAIPTPVDVAEIYAALEQGLVDGEHLQPVWLQLLKHDEVVKYGTEIQALAVYRGLVMNEASYQKLDVAQKEVFDQAMAYFQERGYHYNRELRGKALEAIAAKGVVITELTADELAQWKEVGRALWETDLVKNSVSAETVDAVLAAQAK
jgi:TRAP-type C4-dicarboxylate transport system substrate-binding protein